jgi:protein-tyrosine-phosphatase
VIDPAASRVDQSVRYPVRVLFLRTGNSARSQIAEALLTKKGGERFVVASAGTAPAAAVRTEAIAALNAIGIDRPTRCPRASLAS